MYCENADGDEDESEETKICLLIRLKNCTGNLIRLEFERPNIKSIEIEQSKIALSIDEMFKNQRNRTVQQAFAMVIRWRTISNGYYDH